MLQRCTYFSFLFFHIDDFHKVFTLQWMHLLPKAFLVTFLVSDLSCWYGRRENICSFIPSGSLYFFSFFLLEYSCFAVLFSFLLYSKVNQLHMYICPLSFGLLSHLGHHRALSPMLYHRRPSVIYFIMADP